MFHYMTIICFNLRPYLFTLAISPFATSVTKRELAICSRSKIPDRPGRVDRPQFLTQRR